MIHEKKSLQSCRKFAECYPNNGDIYCTAAWFSAFINNFLNFFSRMSTRRIRTTHNIIYVGLHVTKMRLYGENLEIVHSFAYCNKNDQNDCRMLPQQWGYILYCCTVFCIHNVCKQFGHQSPTSTLNSLSITSERTVYITFAL